MVKNAFLTLSLLCGLLLWTSCGKKGGETKTDGDKKNKPTAVETSANPDKLVIWWAQWAPADGLQKVANEFAQANNTTVEVKQIPWPEFQPKSFQEFSNEKTDFDILIGDSQWLGKASKEGWYLDLTEFVNSGGVDMADIAPAVSKYLCKDPQGKIVAAPCEPDAMGIVYRADLFKKHGITAPKTWEDILAACQKINKEDPSINGWVSPAKGGGDSITMSYQNFLYAFGGEWGKVDDGKYVVKGIVNSDAAVQGLDFYKKLLATSSPQFKELNYNAQEKFKNGSTAVLMTFFAFFPDIEANKKEGWELAYMPIPPLKADGKAIASLGGQGFSISTKTSAKKQELAKKFIKWFNTPEVQKKWIANPGCFTSSKSVMASEDYAKMSPYNQAFKESLDILVDFWNVPGYAELLNATEKFLGEAVDETKSSKEALNAIAKKHQEIFDSAK